MATDSATRGAHTRTRLLDAAVQLIVEEGWGAVTTRKMADRAGVRAGVVHYHFGTVTDLLVDAALDALRRELMAALGVLREARDASAGIADLLAVLQGYSPEDPATVLMSETLLASTRIERLRSELSGLMRELRGAMADWLRARDSVPDPEATAAVLGAALDGLVLHCLLDPELRTTSLAGPLTRLTGTEETPDDTDRDGTR
ncbi:TetR/AcrR family transcriptional regulator [Streptomyces boncukensis]|uniref:TetR family transcriptional regulator n=1 Tax=Streptomyces boncukensis TaxID=2711219 RepID=A0A6G4X1S6_9ACTN|nr:TetR family transcriptional regulator [Streptomyces boncukensis]NGO71082.1 TetR family transcriptional regulator [Streptomyces boncukensis]